MTTAFQVGFTERWLRRCGRRPFRTFLILWAVFFLALCAIGFVGLQRKQMPGVLLDPRGIDYARLLPDGSHTEHGGLRLDPQTLPTYDPTLDRRDVGLHMRPGGPGEPPRLIAIVHHSQWLWGWPWFVLGGGSQQSWDVSDPSKPFRPVGGQWLAGWILSGHGLSIPRFSSDGSRVWSIGIEMAGASFMLAVPQLLAAAIVIPGWIAYRWRLRNRLAGNRCVECGHQRDASRPDASCPECGRSLAASLAVKRRIVQRPGAISAVLFIVLLVPWAIVQLLLSETHPHDSIQTQIERRQKLGKVHVGRLYAHSSGYGWPLMIASTQTNHYYLFSPGSPPTRVPCTDPFFVWDHTYFTLFVRHSDPSTATLVSFFWPVALAETALLQIGATIAACTFSGLAGAGRQFITGGQ